MKTNFLYILIILSYLAGCKTTKQLSETKTDTNLAIATDIEITSDSVVDVSVVHIIEGTAESTDSLIVNEVTVVLSKPDSTGFQYAEKITYRESVNVKTNKKETNHARDSTSRTALSEVYTDNSDLKSETTVTTKTKIKTKTPKYVWLIIVFLLILGFLLIRRFWRFNPFRI